MFNRTLVKRGADGLPQSMQPGDGWLANPSLAIQAADSNQLIPATTLSGGLYIRNGMTAGRTDTTDSAINILAANAGMDIGDNLVVGISVTTAQILTIAAGAGVTLVGKTTVPANGFGFFVITRTGEATVSFRGL